MSTSVSVVIPTKDRPDMLREAIGSVLAQTLAASEIVVVDNGPRSGAAAVAGEFGGAVTLVRFLSPGPSAARNAGIERCRSHYVAFLDDDDLWHPEKLSIQMEFLENHPNIAMASCRVVPYGDEIRVRKTPWVAGDLYGGLFMKSFVATPSVVVRRDVFDVVGGFDVRYTRAEDYDLWLRIADAFQTSHLNAPLVWVRKSPTRLSSDKIDLRKNALMILRERHNPDKVPPRRFNRRMSDLLVYLGREEGKTGDIKSARLHFREAMRLTPLRLRPIRYLIGTVFS